VSGEHHRAAAALDQDESRVGNSNGRRRYGAEGSRKRALGSARLLFPCVRVVFFFSGSGFVSARQIGGVMDSSDRWTRADPWEVGSGDSICWDDSAQVPLRICASRFGLPRVLLVGMHANYYSLRFKI
jgi:hypothetical protein